MNNKRKSWKCPRCGNWVTDFPAISRRDDKTEICSRCGTEEALNDFTRDKFGRPVKEEIRCMDCGKPIKHKREAPSGSFLPRCSKCNRKRWRQYFDSESEQIGRTSPGINNTEVWDDFDYGY